MTKGLCARVVIRDFHKYWGPPPHSTILAGAFFSAPFDIQVAIGLSLTNEMSVEAKHVSPK